jgi:hypothetical protein
MLGRYVKWMRALNGFMLYPILGLGPSAFGTAVDGNYFRLIGENGIVGALAFIWLIYSVFSISIKCRKNYLSNIGAREYSEFIFISLVVLLLCAVFIDVFEASKIALLFWLLVGFLVKIYASDSSQMRKEGVT